MEENERKYRYFYKIRGGIVRLLKVCQIESVEKILLLHLLSHLLLNTIFSFIKIFNLANLEENERKYRYFYEIRGGLVRLLHYRNLVTYVLYHFMKCPIIISYDKVLKDYGFLTASCKKIYFKI